MGIYTAHEAGLGWMAMGEGPARREVGSVVSEARGLTHATAAAMVVVVVCVFVSEQRLDRGQDTECGGVSGPSLYDRQHSDPPPPHPRGPVRVRR
jgi:hypothetical protein